MADNIKDGLKSINSESKRNMDTNINNNINIADKRWQEFLNTGTVAAYLNYKSVISNQ